MRTSTGGDHDIVQSRQIAADDAAALLCAAIGLSGCFDFSQSVAINRDGSGQYQFAIAARGVVGDALKDGKSDIHIGHLDNAHTRTSIVDGKVTRTSSADFKQLSDLNLSNESMAIKVRGHDLFGLGQTHAIFRRIFLIDNARRARQRDDNGNAGAAVVASIFGDHVNSRNPRILRCAADRVRVGLQNPRFLKIAPDRLPACPHESVFRKCRCSRCLRS
jgi:hypothetical protein